MNLSIKDFQRIEKIVQHYEKQIDTSISIPASEYEERFKKCLGEDEGKIHRPGIFLLVSRNAW